MFRSVKGDTTVAEKKKYTFGEILKALFHRKSGAMYILGMAAGLPYILITGTINAWFTAENISIKTIGVFSWIIIFYAFKFFWSPAIDRARFPAFFNMGQRRAGILILQGIIILMLTVIAFSSPTTQIGQIAIAAAICTFCSASQDILIDAWRIEVADEKITVDLLSSVYQIGYRTSAILGGAGALFMAARMGWGNTFLILVVLMAICVSGVFLALESPYQKKEIAVPPGSPPVGWRNLAIVPIVIFWAWSLYALFSFMGFALLEPENANAGAFTRNTGPIIIFISIIIPFLIAAYLLYKSRTSTKNPSPIRFAGITIDSGKSWPRQSIFDALYNSVLVPMMDFINRLKFGALLVLVLVLSYRFADLVWGAFAYPFYLGENYGALGHTYDEVAVASKIFGTLMTAFGIVVGGAAVLRFGRMPCLVVGAILAAATNLLFADLALGAPLTDRILSFAHLYQPFAIIFQPMADFLSLDVTMNEKLVQLMMVIAAENLAVGFASAAIVVYLSSIVNPEHAAVQYALLASLTFLIGSLGRGALGELIELRGFAYVFYLTAVLGCVAVVASILEWIRQSRAISTNTS